MELNLFSGILEPEEISSGFTLWFRPSDSRRSKWTKIATAATTLELLSHMDQVGSGDFNIQPAGKEPGPSKQL